MGSDLKRVKKKSIRFALGCCSSHVTALNLITVNGKHRIHIFFNNISVGLIAEYFRRLTLERLHKWNQVVEQNLLNPITSTAGYYILSAWNEQVGLMHSTFSHKCPHSHILAVEEAGSLLVICHSSLLYYTPPLFHTPNPSSLFFSSFLLPLLLSFHLPKSFLYMRVGAPSCCDSDTS